LGLQCLSCLAGRVRIGTAGKQNSRTTPFFLQLLDHGIAHFGKPDHVLQLLHVFQFTGRVGDALGRKQNESDKRGKHQCDQFPAHRQIVDEIHVRASSVNTLAIMPKCR